jgi:hypothetical protein
MPLTSKLAQACNRFSRMLAVVRNGAIAGLRRKTTFHLTGGEL